MRSVGKLAAFAAGRMNVGLGDVFERVAIVPSHLIVQGLEGIIVVFRGTVEHS